VVNEPAYAQPILGLGAAIDSSDIIHVVYVNYLGSPTYDKQLYYLYRDPSTGWSVKENVLGVDDTIGLLFPRIAVDSSDDVHCVFHRGSGPNKRVSYVKRTSGVWGIQVELARKGDREATHKEQDICVDSNDYLHVVYRGTGAEPRLHYMLYNGSWQAEETLAGTGSNEQSTPNVMVDSGDVVHVVWAGEGYAATYPNYYQICHIAGNTGAWGPVEVLTDASQPQGWYGLAAGINDLDEIDICFGGKPWSIPNPTWTTGNHIKYSGGAWGDVTVLSDYNIGTVFDMLWAATPAQCSLPTGFIALILGSIPPTVTTEAMTDVKAPTATGNGTVTDLGDVDPTQHGHCWSTSPNPTIADDKTELGPKTATGAFTSSLTELTAGTLYYCRAYATSTAGTAYGSEETFTTLSKFKGNPNVDQRIYQHVERMD